MTNPLLDPKLDQRLAEATDRLSELDQELSSPGVLSDPDRLRELGQERAYLQPLVTTTAELRGALEELSGARDLAEDSDDPDMRELAELEVASLKERIDDLLAEVRELLIPPDPLEDRPAVVEIRAGAGGDEAGLFASDLMRMYQRMAERRNWKVELMSLSEGIPGAIREAVFLVKGKGVFGRLRYESGVHRVQRVPETESQGRIHTSAASVAVLPEAEEVDLQIDPNDLRIDVFRSSGPGGQSVNTTDSAVRITHIPTGVVVSCQDEKSQHKNKSKAMKVLRSRLLDRMIAEQEAERARERRTMVGTGDRSAKIRTYNFPQNRVTDHRINLTVHNLEDVLDGELDEFVSALRMVQEEERLEASTASAADTSSTGATPRSDESWTVLRMMRWSGEYLEEKGVERGRLDAEHLLAHALGTQRLQLYLQFDRPLSQEELDGYRPLLLRRARREPLQYILGQVGFRELELAVDERVLIPRPETEVLVQAILEWAAEEARGPDASLRGLDVGTGSGAIALSLLREGPFHEMVATDVSEKALEVARENARTLELDDRVDFRHGPVFDPVAGERFHVVASNPPYIGEPEAEELQAEVRDWEPATALFAGPDGLDTLRLLAAGAHRHLEAGGLLALEVGASQARTVAQGLDEHRAYHDVRIQKDLAGRERVVLAQA